MAKLSGLRMYPERSWVCDVEQTWVWGLDGWASETQLTLLIIIAKILMIIITTD